MVHACIGAGCCDTHRGCRLRAVSWWRVTCEGLLTACDGDGNDGG